MINTLLYTKKLEAVGLTRDEAEAHVQILAEVIEVSLATKHDLKELEYRLIIRLGTLTAALLTVFAAIIGVLIKVP